MKLIGHRGSKGEYPENTFLGIEKAILNSMEGVEIDVRLTKDKQLVVIHDETVDRTSKSKGLVSEMTLDELKKLDFGKGEKIPTLQEVMSITREAGIELAIELKEPSCEKKVAMLIKKNNSYKRCIVKSFNHKYLLKIKEIDPEIRTACLLVGLPVDAPRMIKDAKADAISLHCDYVDKELVKSCHNEGFMVIVWNIDEKEKLKRYRAMGVDYVGTNYPSRIGS